MHTYKGYSIRTVKSEIVQGTQFWCYEISKDGVTVISAWDNGTHYEFKSKAIEAAEARIDWILSK